MFSMQSVSKNPLLATFQLSSAASLKLGRSQNSVLGNGLSIDFLSMMHQGHTLSHPLPNSKVKHPLIG